MKAKKDETVLTISPKSPETKWVALNNEDKIIAEEKIPEEAINKAKKITDDFVIVFIPSKENNYVFLMAQALVYPFRKISEEISFPLVSIRAFSKC